MKIRSKVFCLIEGIAFSLYCRTLRYPAVERNRVAALLEAFSWSMSAT